MWTGKNCPPWVCPDKHFVELNVGLVLNKMILKHNNSVFELSFYGNTVTSPQLRNCYPWTPHLVLYIHLPGTLVFIINLMGVIILYSISKQASFSTYNWCFSFQWYNCMRPHLLVGLFALFELCFLAPHLFKLLRD